ncbi:MAG: F0F1 ATP synthase subunit epsilon [Propionibacteriaceae bacterium]
MATGVMKVEVVAADRIVWEGEATSVVARTVEGDIGILLNHEPLLAALVPCAAEIIATDGNRYIIAVDGGFISVHNNQIALLSQFGRLADEIDPSEAEEEYRKATVAREAGDTSADNERHLQRAQAQLKAIEKLSH